MPNHVRNVLKFSKLNPADKEFILNNFTVETEDDIYPLNKRFDFDKIIPEPRVESDCPEDYKVNKDSHVMEDKDRPWFDWYKWRNKYWNTKWNAYDSYIHIGTNTITFVFSTAWSIPWPIYEKLVKEYKYNFEVQYADEDIGHNCGRLIYNPEKTGFDDLVHISEHDLSHPEEYARRIWRNY